MLRMMAALVLSIALVLMSGKKVIAWLRKLHFGQTIYDLGPDQHKKKQGTPIMGGLMVAGAAAVSCLLLHPKDWYGAQDFMLALLAVSFLSMAVGFADDWIKATKKRHEGLTPWQKIAGQVIVAIGFTLYCYFHPLVGSSIIVPLLGVEWDLGFWYIPLMTLTVIFIVNSANLQDGLDGLLSGVTSVGCAGWAMISVLILTAASALGNGQLNSSLYACGIFALAVCGGAMGFLRFNRYPAQVFLGDSGSMFIGGATVGLAMLMRQPLLLIPIAFTMIGSSLSVILQRIYFKLTHGKRIFKMSPIHHHFEKCGYTEPQIDSMYCVATGVLTLLAVLSVYGLTL